METNQLKFQPSIYQTKKSETIVHNHGIFVFAEKLAGKKKLNWNLFQYSYLFIHFLGVGYGWRPPLATHCRHRRGVQTSERGKHALRVTSSGKQHVRQFLQNRMSQLTTPIDLLLKNNHLTYAKACISFKSHAQSSISVALLSYF